MFLVLLLPGGLPARIRYLQGKVTSVKDGDTIEILQHRKAYRIRLNGIDCPEKRQAYGMQAKQFTAKLCFGKTVSAKVYNQDRYKRYVADIILPNGSVLNKELLRAGLAWHYKHYSKDKVLAALEEEAKAKKAGLWADKAPVPPWKYRRH